MFLIFEYACRAKNTDYKLIVDYSKYCLQRPYKNLVFLGQKVRQINLAQLRKLLFGKKSQINIVDHFILFYYVVHGIFSRLIIFTFLRSSYIYSPFLPPFFPLGTCSEFTQTSFVWP